jgi:hypothetical protein
VEGNSTADSHVEPDAVTSHSSRLYFFDLSSRLCCKARNGYCHGNDHWSPSIPSKRTILHPRSLLMNFRVWRRSHIVAVHKVHAAFARFTPALVLLIYCVMNAVLKSSNAYPRPHLLTDVSRFSSPNTNMWGLCSQLHGYYNPSYLARKSDVPFKLSPGRSSNRCVHCNLPICRRDCFTQAVSESELYLTGLIACF